MSVRFKDREDLVLSFSGFHQALSSLESRAKELLKTKETRDKFYEDRVAESKSLQFYVVGKDMSVDTVTKPLSDFPELRELYIDTLKFYLVNSVSDVREIKPYTLDSVSGDNGYFASLQKSSTTYTNWLIATTGILYDLRKVVENRYTKLVSWYDELVISELDNPLTYGLLMPINKLHALRVPQWYAELETTESLPSTYKEFESNRTMTFTEKAEAVKAILQEAISVIKEAEKR